MCVTFATNPFVQIIYTNKKKEEKKNVCQVAENGFHSPW
jgi:hypothetical protein